MNNVIETVFAFFLGALLVFCLACALTTSNRTLEQAGIDRIAYCCNAYSNWYEIVWIKEGKAR